MGHGTDNATVYKTLLFTLYIPGALCIHTYPQVDLEAVDNHGYTALHCAARDGYDTIVVQLLQAKANIEAVDNNGYTALHCAAASGHNTIVGQLLQAKANPTAVTKNGQTALQIAEQHGNQDVVQRLRQVHSP